MRDGVVGYDYLGYDPAYLRHSVGTVLQWLALEHLFGEGRHLLFDFTEGESEHKRLFATASASCANVAFLRPTLANRLLVCGHHGFHRVVERIGDGLEHHDLKRRVRRWLRFGGVA